MKKFVTASLAFASLTATAMAADLPRRAAPPVFTPVPVFTWTGFYAGFNAGGAFTTNNRGTAVAIPAGLFGAANPVVPTTAFFSSRERSGFTGGGQLGYNYQFTPGSGVVVGFETDIQYIDFATRRTNNVVLAPAVATPGVIFANPGNQGLEYYGTVRGRLGYAFDRVLVYGTGGFAYGGGGTSNAFVRDDIRTGYAAGGGIEYALPTDSFLNFFRSSAVTLRVEGMYVSLDRNNRAPLFAVNVAQTPFFAGGLGRRSDEFAVVRAAVNYKFGTY